MRKTEIAIVGGGLAGSITAAMLGRVGTKAVLIDPRIVYPPDFRCEKLDGLQASILKKTGLADAVLRASTWDRVCWVARLGCVVEKKLGDQQGILYDTLVNTIRAEIRPEVDFIQAKATRITTSTDRQTITLSNGDEISARLVVLANGLNIGIRDALGLTRNVFSECHSISIGFDVDPIGRRTFVFPALTYYAEHPRNRTAYLTVFPIGAKMRANLFVYRELRDPWLSQFREAPQQTLLALMPGLRKLMGDFCVTSAVKIRPIDLYETQGHRQAGVVLVGDAFATSCPAAGTGALKTLTDVERLCNVHIPGWLDTPGMGLEKISQFYDDPIKKACDAFSLTKAYNLRTASINENSIWFARRWLKFLAHYGLGAVRQVRRHGLSARRDRNQNTAISGGQA